MRLSPARYRAYAMLRFGAFTLDPDRYVLAREGSAIPVEPIVFDLIARLAAAPGEVFSRERLMETVWGGRLVSEATISTCVKSARRALDDDGKAQRMIRTVRGRGYSFVAEVDREDADAQQVASTQPAPLPILVVGAASGAVEIEALAWSVAGVLTRMPLVQVRVSTHDAPLPEGALRLRVQSEGAKVRATLADAQGALRCSLLTTRTGASVALVRGVEPALEAALLERARAAGDASREALHAAHALLSVEGWHPRAFEEAARLLRRSLDAPDAPPLASALLALVLAFGHRIGVTRSEERRAEAIALAERALEQAPADASVLGYAGCALADAGAPERGAPFLEEALALRPENAHARVALGSVALMRGETGAAIDALEAGIASAPHDPRLAVWGAILAMAHLRAGHAEEARAAAERANARDRRAALPHLARAAIAAAHDEIDHARAALAEARRVHPSLDAHQIRAFLGRRLAELLSGDT